MSENFVCAQDDVFIHIRVREPLFVLMRLRAFIATLYARLPLLENVGSSVVYYNDTKNRM